jgi:hypothetical protein
MLAARRCAASSTGLSPAVPAAGWSVGVHKMTTTDRSIRTSDESTRSLLALRRLDAVRRWCRRPSRLARRRSWRRFAAAATRVRSPRASGASRRGREARWGSTGPHSRDLPRAVPIAGHRPHPGLEPRVVSRRIFARHRRRPPSALPRSEVAAPRSTAEASLQSWFPGPPAPPHARCRTSKADIAPCGSEFATCPCCRRSAFVMPPAVRGLRA